MTLLVFEGSTSLAGIISRKTLTDQASDNLMQSSLADLACLNPLSAVREALLANYMGFSIVKFCPPKSNSQPHLLPPSEWRKEIRRENNNLDAWMHVGASY